MPWSGEDDECGRVSDGPAGIEASAVSPKGDRRPKAGEAGNDRTGIVRQPQFGQSSEGLGVARASDEEGKKMKDFHSPSLTPVECVNLLPSGAGPA